MAPTFNGIGHVTADMASTLAFYRTLGLDLPAELDTEPHAEVELAGGVRLMWDDHATMKAIDPAWTPGAGQPEGSLAFLCADAAEVDATYEKMVKAGYHGDKEPWDAFWGQRYAVLHDPDGHTVDLFAWLPRQ